MWVPGSRKNKYVNDYKIDEQGRYVYYGTVYHWEKPERRRPVLVTLWVLTVISIVLAILAGCIPAPGVNTQAFLLLPYAISAAVCIYSEIGLFHLTQEKDPVRDHVYTNNVKKLPLRYTIAAIAAFIAAAAEILYFSRSGSAANLKVYAVLFTVLELVTGVLAMVCSVIVGKLNWIPEKNAKRPS